eukprot:8390212-Pyramimonas_sp.AAC.1
MKEAARAADVWALLCCTWPGSPLRTPLTPLPIEPLGAKRVLLRVNGVPRLVFDTALAPLSVRKDKLSTTSVDRIPPVQAKRKASVIYDIHEHVQHSRCCQAQTTCLTTALLDTSRMQPTIL